MRLLKICHHNGCRCLGWVLSVQSQLVSTRWSLGFERGRSAHDCLPLSQRG